MKASSPARLVRWALRLAEFDFEIKYRKGGENGKADALSRLSQESCKIWSTELVNVLISVENLEDKIKEHQRKDPELIDIIKELEANHESVIPFTLTRDLLYFHRYDGKYLLVIPQETVPELLELYRAHELSVHMSRDRLYHTLKKQYYWKGMFQDISRWVAACPRCSTVKTNIPTQAGLLQPIITSQPFEIVAIDIMGPLQKSPDGFKYLLNIIDLYTSWPEAIPLRTLTAIETTKAFQEFITRHSCPQKVLSDRGTSFTSELFNSVCKRFGIGHLFSSAYHHQTIGKVERFHK